MKELVKINTDNGSTFTTSKIISDQFDKNHFHVMRDIRTLIERGAPSFGLSSYINDQNKSQPMYTMDRDGFALLAMGFTGPKALEFKLEFIGAFNAMEATLNSPELIMARALKLADSKMKELEYKIEIDKPKVEFADKVMEAETDIPIGVMAKLLGTGRNKFFSMLRDEGILCKLGRMRNVATQSYIDRGYFTVTEKPIDINDFVVLKYTTLVTPKGQDWLVRKFR